MNLDDLVAVSAIEMWDEIVKFESFINFMNFLKYFKTPFLIFSLTFCILIITNNSKKMSVKFNNS